jgi:hypothetical protein
VIFQELDLYYISGQLIKPHSFSHTSPQDRIGCFSAQIRLTIETNFHGSCYKFDRWHVLRHPKLPALKVEYDRYRLTRDGINAKNNIGKMHFNILELNAAKRRVKLSQERVSLVECLRFGVCIASFFYFFGH